MRDGFYTNGRHAGNIGPEEELDFVKRRDASVKDSDEYVSIVGDFCEKTLYLVERFLTRPNGGALGIDQDDLVESYLMTHHRACKRFQAQSLYSTYLFRALSNTKINVITAARRRPYNPSLDRLLEDGFDVADSSSRPDESLVRDEQFGLLSVALEKAMADLNPFQAQVIGLRLKGFTLEEIAQITGIKNGTVRSATFYAKKIIQEKLSKLGII